ncbi:MAG: tetratricopeptide repeat protein [Verrucomicrobiota bacterium]
MKKTKLRLFLSSPGDVAQERRIAERVVDRLNAEFSNVTLDPYFWEYEPMVITKDYQEQIPAPSQFDIVICILWSRMGSRLHTKYKRKDGTEFRSGTEFEFVDAVEGQQRNNGVPDILVWVNKTQPLIPLEPEDAHMERLRQWKELKAFMEDWTKDKEELTFKGAVNRYGRLDEFEEKLEVKLRKLIEARTKEEASAEIEAEITWNEGSPFRGLEAFHFEHAPIFFGRTAAVAEVIDGLRRQILGPGSSFLMVAGGSGSGKSSLVRAGVLPMLVEPGVIEGVGLWRRAVMHPGDGDDPFEAAALALLEPDALPELGSDGTTAEEIATMLRKNPDELLGLARGALAQAASLHHLNEKQAFKERISAFKSQGRKADATAARKRLKALKPPVARLVLMIDQFEEIFAEDIDPTVRKQFVNLASALAASGRFVAIATIRSDFFAHCAEFPALLELMRGDGIFHLGPPTPAELGQMIRQPAQAAGLRFEEDSKDGESLDEVLRDAAVEQPTVLPLLGFCLQQLYEKRSKGRDLTFEAYREIGEVEGAVARRAEEVYSQLSADAQNEFPRLVRSTVTMGDHDDETVTRQRAEHKILVRSPAMAELVERFVDARLYIIDAAENEEPRVGVAHEALLRCWPRMAEAIDSDRHFLKIRFRIARAARRWRDDGEEDALLLPSGVQLEEGRDMLESRWDELSNLEVRFIERSSEFETEEEQKRLRRLQLVTVAFASLALIAMVAGFNARKQQKRAEERRVQAVQLRAGADDLIGSTLYDLRDELTAIGRLDALEDVSIQAESYFSSIPEDLLDKDTERKLGTLLNWRGGVLKSLGRIEEAKLKFEQGIAIARKRYEADPEGEQRSRDLAVALGNLARLCRETGELDRAETIFNEISSLPIDENHPLAQQDRMLDLIDHGDLMKDKGEWEKAADLYQEAVVIGNEIDFDPQYRTEARNIPNAYDRLAVAKRALGDHEGAAGFTWKALEIREALVTRFPNELLFQSDLVVALNKAAPVAAREGDNARADAIAARSLKIARSLLEQNPNDNTTKLQLLYAINGQGSRLMLSPNPETYAKLFREGAELARELLESAPGIREHASMLATHLNGLAFSQMQQGDFVAAIASAEEAISALDSVGTLVHDSKLPYQGAYGYLIRSHRENGASAEILQGLFQRALYISTRFQEAGLSDPQTDNLIAWIQTYFADNWNPSGAATTAQKAITELDGAEITPAVVEAYKINFDRLFDAHYYLRTPETGLTPLRRSLLNTYLRIQKAGLGDPVIDSVVTSLQSMFPEG